MGAGTHSAAHFRSSNKHLEMCIGDLTDPCHEQGCAVEEANRQSVEPPICIAGAESPARAHLLFPRVNGTCMVVGKHACPASRWVDAYPLVAGQNCCSVVMLFVA